MLQLVVDHSPTRHPAGSGIEADYGVWTGHTIPEDRSGWHPLVRDFFDYWRSKAPNGQLPGRQHITPEEVPGLLSRIWMLDIQREPPRYRYRLCGTEIVRSLGREVTGMWLDEAHPELIANPVSRDRFRFMIATGCPSWRRGSPLWTRDPDHRTVESCIAPLASDGCTVDKMVAITVMYDIEGRQI